MKEFTYTKRLSETKLMESLDFSKPFKVMVSSETGSGKTHYITNYLKDNNIPFVFLADTLLLMKQIAKDYGISTFSAANKDAYYESQLISVYNHIEKLYRGKVVIIDEAHSLVTDYGYRGTVIEDLLTFIGEADQIIMLSGTPLISRDPVYKGMEEFKCISTNPKEYVIKVHNTSSTDNTLEYAVELAKQLRKEGKTPVISLLSKGSRLNTLISLLKSNGFSDVGMINSVVKDGELNLDSSHYKELIENGTISADAIITTYTQGYNINNKDCGLIFVPSNGRHSYIAIAQMVARFRLIDNLDCHLIVKESTGEDNSKPLRNFTRLRDYITEEKYNDIAKHITAATALFKTERGLRHFLEKDDKIKHLIDNKTEVKHQMIALEVVNALTNLMYRDMITANTILNQYNIKLIETPTIIITDMKKEDLTPIDYTIAVETFFNLMSVHQTSNTSMQISVREHYDKLREFRLLNKTIKAILLETFGNKRAFNKVLLAFKFRLSNSVDIKRTRKDIFQSFTKGEWYSSQYIFDKVSAILIDNGFECKSKNRASEILNFLFETESVLMKEDGKVIRGLVIGAIKPTTISVLPEDALIAKTK